MSKSDHSMRFAEPPPPVARNGAGAVFAVFLAGGLMSAGWGWMAGDIALPPAQLTLEKVLDGETARTLAAQLVRSPLPARLADLERAGAWILAGNLGPRVRQGCPGWLFLGDELLVHAEGQANAARRLEAVVAIRDELAALGSELVVLTVPDKSRIQNAELCSIYRPAAIQDRVRYWQDGLRAQGVKAVSLLEPYEAATDAADGAWFLRTDTHWNERGARVAAKAVAEAVSQIGIDPSPPRRYALERGAPETVEGDLVRLAGIAWLPDSLKPEADRLTPTVFVEREVPASQESGPDLATALLGDTGRPALALIGTSYSGASQFVPFLEQELGVVVPNFAQEGGDFWRAASQYFDSPSFKSSAPTVVVWEIPERVIQQPLAPDESAWLASLAKTP